MPCAADVGGPTQVSVSTEGPLIPPSPMPRLTPGTDTDYIGIIDGCVTKQHDDLALRTGKS